MNLRRLAVSVLLGSVLTLLWLFVAGVFSWGYYSTGLSHYVAAMLAWPFFVAMLLPVPEVAQMAVGFAIMFVSATLVVYLVGGVLARLRRKGQ